MFSCNKFCTVFNSDENYVSYELLTEAVLQVVNKLSSKYKTGMYIYNGIAVLNFVLNAN